MTTVESDGGGSSVVMQVADEGDKQSGGKPGIMGGARTSLRNRKEDGGGNNSNHDNNNGGSTNNSGTSAGGGRSGNKDGEGRSSGRIRSSGDNDSTRIGPSGSLSTTANTTKKSKAEGGGGPGRGRAPDRWRSQKMAEDYINLVGDLMYPKVGFGPYGYDAVKGEIPLERPNTLGAIMCPVRRRTVIEHWSPFEVACFEGAIMLVGKNFYEIAKLLRSKSTKDCIEFYYVWKMTSHYQQWKRGFEPLDPHPFSILPQDDD
ncbi:myb dna binding protein transcription factor-like protein [Nannochloropsis oceanica]